jgi:hypothetical protein
MKTPYPIRVEGASSGAIGSRSALCTRMWLGLVNLDRCQIYFRYFFAPMGITNSSIGSEESSR